VNGILLAALVTPAMRIAKPGCSRSFGLAGVLANDFSGAFDGFAAGALLVMLVDSMAPEARRKAGRSAGLATTVGFALGVALSSLS
jgi:zinc transporter, ZIP family